MSVREQFYKPRTDIWLQNGSATRRIFPSTSWSTVTPVKLIQGPHKTRKPLLEVAPTNLVQRTGQPKLRHVVTSISSRKRNIFILWPWTL